MCQVPSWITADDGTVLFLTDKVAKAHGIRWNDATGHLAIRRVWPGAQGGEGEGLGRDTPPEVVRSLLSAGMNAIAAAYAAEGYAVMAAVCAVEVASAWASARAAAKAAEKEKQAKIIKKYLGR